MKKTKQGVRDLGGNDRRPKRTPLPDDVKRAICEHPRIKRVNISDDLDRCDACGWTSYWRDFDITGRKGP